MYNFVLGSNSKVAEAARVTVKGGGCLWTMLSIIELLFSELSSCSLIFLGPGHWPLSLYDLKLNIQSNKCPVSCLPGSFITEPDVEVAFP